VTDAVIHQHPLVYLLGLEGVALMKAFDGEYDREFIHARIAEIRDRLDRAAALGERTDVRPLHPARGPTGRGAYDVRLRAVGLASSRRTNGGGVGR
jgi:hypothetical protein